MARSSNAGFTSCKPTSRKRAPAGIVKMYGYIVSVYIRVVRQKSVFLFGISHLRSLVS